MLLIGCDYHPSVQQIAMLDTETGDYSEHRLKHSDGEAEKFYRDLKLHTPQIRVGLEATGHRRWFERLLMELDCELWVGDAARIATMRVRKQKTDRQDAQLLLKLMTDPTRVFTKEHLLREVWDFRSLGRTRTLDSHASRLRRKLSVAQPGSVFVINVWGVGYRLLDA